MASDSANEFTYKSQDVHYLGFLEAQLRDLHGIATLAYELVQNADDVLDGDGRAQTTTLSFDVTDEALVVVNDGVFRAVDFERLQSIASGGKRDEVGTTGAFGLGFLAVYQVTDTPEIFSNGRHWLIRPDAPPDQRIEERLVETDGTRFRLPWAFDPASLVRRTLRIEAVRPDQLDEFAAQLSTAVELAALFLKQLQVLEVRRNGRVIKQITRLTSANHQILLQDETGQTATWLLFDGDFAAEAERLRSEYPWQIEEKRHSEVRLAIPATGLDRTGQLFAVLPTDSASPLPFHINADFYPTTDRKRIHFDSGYQAEWNRAAISCAAEILAVSENFDALPAFLGPIGFWHLLQKMSHTKRLADQADLPAVFAAFWQAIAPALPQKAILYSSTGEWLLPANTRLVQTPRLNQSCVPLLEALHIPVAHPDLAAYFDLMRQPEIGVQALTIQDIAVALSELGLGQQTLARPLPLHQAPPFWRSLPNWQQLWELINNLLNHLSRLSERESALATLDRCALVLTDQMTLEPLSRVYKGKHETKALFPDVRWVHDAIAPDRFPGRYLPNFGVRQAVDWLAEMPIDQLEAAWRTGRLDIPRLFRWFESEQIEILADDPTLPPRIRRLPLCPVAGELRPLADLYIPGGFEDPLELAGIVDLAELGGRRQFLLDLGAQELDFETYVHSQLPQALAQNPDLPSDARHRLVQLLAERLGEIRDDDELQAQLSHLPLIACMDGAFRAANTVYASREVMGLLGERVHIAEPVESRAMTALYHWLEVKEQPTGTDIVESLLTISQKWRGRALDAPTLAVVRQCWQMLNVLLEQKEVTAVTLSPLHNQKVIPNQRHLLTPPNHLFVADQPDLAAQFNGLGLEDYLLPAEEDWTATAVATTAAGVRPLSQAVQLEIVRPTNTVNQEIQNRISNRRPLIKRLLQAEPGAWQTDFLDDLRVVQLPQVQVCYQLQIGEERLTTAATSVTAKIIGSTLYLSDEQSRSPWTAVARELAVAIKGDTAVGGLAIGLREVLSAATFADAARTLDELGYTG